MIILKYGSWQLDINSELNANYNVKLFGYIFFAIILLINLSCKEYKYNNPVDASVKLTSPQEFSITIVNDTTITAAWKAAATSSNNYNAIIEMKSDSTDYRVIKTVPAINDSANINTILLLGKTYSFRIRLGADKNYSDYFEVNGKKIVFHPPINLTVTSLTETKASFNWSGTSFENGFQLEKSINDTNFTLLKDIPAKTTTIEVDSIFKTNTTYYFRIRAYTNHNFTAYSSQTYEYISFQAPSYLTVSFSSDTSATLQWQDNSTIETGFEIDKSTDGANFTLAKSVSSNTEKTNISGIYLTGQTYYFRVRAKTANNYSPYTQNASGQLQFNAPSNLSVSFSSDTSATIQWQDNSSFESGFDIEKSTDGINFTFVKSAMANTVTTSISGTYLTNQTYYFRLRAKTSHNYSLYSQTVSSKLQLKLDAPTNLAVSFPLETSATLQWTDNSTMEIGFDIEKSTDGTNFTLVKSVPINTVNTAITGIYLTTQTYYFRVRAKTTNNYYPYSSPISGELRFEAPSNLSFKSINKSSIEISWQDNSTFETRFIIERSINNSTFAQIGQSLSNQNSFIDNSLDSVNNYTYKIKAVSNYNQSDYSAEINITYNLTYNVTTLIGHLWGINSISFTPDGNVLASGSSDKTIRLWQVSNGSLLQILTGHSDQVMSVVFSPDGKTLAGGGWDKTIKFWSTNNGSLIKTLTTIDDISSIAFSPDGGKIVSGSYGFTIQLWQINQDSSIYVITDYNGNVQCVAFSPDGNEFAASRGIGLIQLWRTSDGSLERTLTDHTSSISSVVFSPDGNILAGGTFKTVQLWRVSDGILLKTFTGHSGQVKSVVFSPDGNKLVSGGGDQTIKVWRVSDGKLIGTLTGHTGDVRSVAFSPDGNTLASGSNDHTIKLWHLGYQWQIVQ